MEKVRRMLPCATSERDRMEYEPFLGEEGEGEDDDVFTVHLNGQASSRARAKRKRLMTLGIIGTICVVVLLVGGLAIAARQGGAARTSTNPPHLEHGLGETNNANGESSSVGGTGNSQKKIHRYKSAAVATDSSQCSSVG
ncbi:hypothetical protein EGW08_002075, partial [Elysia chlorotica]